MMDECELLRQELERVKHFLQEKEQDAQLAAQFGNQLLECNQDLSKQLEDETTKLSSRIEALEQEKYELRVKLEQRERMGVMYEEEMESMKKALQKHNSTNWYKREADLLSQQEALKKQLSSVQNDLDQALLNEKQWHDRAGEMEGQLKDIQGQLEQQRSTVNETLSDDLLALHNEAASLREEKGALLEEIQEARRDASQMHLKLKHLHQQIEDKGHEVDDARRQAMSYFKALEESREETQELKVEIDLLKLEAAGHKKKGNSLFAEVEDKRVEAEKTLVSMRVKYETLEKQYRVSKQSLHKLKIQIAGALNRTCGQADQKYIDMLNSQLSQAKGNEMTLLKKIKDLEDSKKVLMEEAANAMGGKKDDFIRFLKAQVDLKEKEREKMEEEWKAERMMHLAQNNKVIECERQIYNLQQLLDQEKSSSRKFKLKLEDLQLKYEPDKCESKENQRTVITEKIVRNKDNDETEPAQVIKESQNVNNRNDHDKIEPDEYGLHELLTDPRFQRKDKVGASKGRTVRLSDDIDIIGASGGEYLADEQDESQGRRRKGKVYSNVVKAEAVFKEEDCKMQ